MSSHTRAMLEGRIVPTLLRMAWPNILVMVAQSASGLIETWFVSRLGTDALAGMALVFPGFMLMQMLSAGAVGGGISSAVARALGAGRRKDADALVMHAILVNVALGVFFSVLFLVFGAPLYRAMGGEGASLRAALDYSNVVFTGAVLVWVMNALASVVRRGRSTASWRNRTHDPHSRCNRTGTGAGRTRRNFPREGDPPLAGGAVRPDSLAQPSPSPLSRG